METFFSLDLSSGRTRAHRVSGSQVSIVYFDNERFLLSAEMEPGCKPLLKVRFLPGQKYEYDLWEGGDSSGGGSDTGDSISMTTNNNVCVQQAYEYELIHFIDSTPELD